MENIAANAASAMHDALSVVTNDSPSDARRIFAEMSFRERALALAWAVELLRLTRDAQDTYESIERRTWRGIQGVTPA